MSFSAQHEYKRGSFFPKRKGDPIKEILKERRNFFNTRTEFLKFYIFVLKNNDRTEASLEKVKILHKKCIQILDKMKTLYEKIKECPMRSIPEEVKKFKKDYLREKRNTRSNDFFEKKVAEIENHFNEFTKENLQFYLNGTKLTPADMDVLFQLADDFPELIFYGSAASKIQREVKVNDIDARILVEEKTFEKIKELLAKRFTLIPSKNKYFNKLSFTLPDSKLKIDLTLGRIDGPLQYKGNELILPDIIGQFRLCRKPIEDAKHVNFCVGLRRYLVLEKDRFFPDFVYAHQHPEELWAFAPEDKLLQAAKPKGSLNILIKQIEKKRESGILDEKKLKIAMQKPSLGDPKVFLYSWEAIKALWILPGTGIFARKMASPYPEDHNDCYLEIHSVIKERKDGIHGIHNEEIRPFVKSFFNNLINNHWAKKNTCIKTFVLYKDITIILKKLYSKVGIPYPEDGFVVKQHFDFIATKVILYRKNYTHKVLPKEFIEECIASIKDYSYLDLLKFNYPMQGGPVVIPYQNIAPPPPLPSPSTLSYFYARPVYPCREGIFPVPNSSYLEQSSLISQESYTPEVLSLSTPPLPLPSYPRRFMYAPRQVGRSLPNLSAEKGNLKNTA